MVRTKSIDEDAFTVAAGTPHVGGLWDCPLVYSTSIAPSQRATAQASKSRVSEYCTASVYKERRARLRYGCSVLGTSCWWSLGLSFGLQHLHSTFSEVHNTGLQKQSLRIFHCVVGAQRASSTFTVLRYGCSILGTSCAKSLMLGIVHTPSSGQPQRVE